MVNVADLLFALDNEACESVPTKTDYEAHGPVLKTFG